MARPSGLFLARTTLLALWETRVSRVLRAIGLGSVRTTIMTLAVLATLIPALGTAWISYRQNKRAIEAKLTEQLSGQSTQAAREIELWLKEGLYNLRVFAASYEVTENIERGTPQTRARLADYLGSVGDRFPDYDELRVVAPDGRTVASSVREPGPLHLAGDWLAHARAGDPVLGDAYRPDSAAAAAMEAAVPIVSPSGRFLGVLAARLNFRGVEELLREFVSERAGALVVADREGRAVATTGGGLAGLSSVARRRLSRLPGAPVEYETPDGASVVGAMAEVPRTSWSVVAEIPQTAAFAEVGRLRNATALLMVVLMLIVGSLAYGLGLLIVKPLGRLHRAANRVAGGDLEVEVPATGGGELSQLTTVFNDMVRRLREGRVELERLSVTDHLTGLANRRHLTAELEREVRRSERHERRFAVLMLDVDHFKGFNDAHGHPAGDQVLMRLAGVLRDLVREVDTAARYGGEEFLVILPETPGTEAARVAERIRARVAEERFSPNGGAGEVGVTVSIGVAEFPGDATKPDGLIESADQALYQAKEGGRNRVIAAGQPKGADPPTAPVPPRTRRRARG